MLATLLFPVVNQVPSVNSVLKARTVTTCLASPDAAKTVKSWAVRRDSGSSNSVTYALAFGDEPALPKEPRQSKPSPSSSGTVLAMLSATSCGIRSESASIGSKPGSALIHCFDFTSRGPPITGKPTTKASRIGSTA